jgi:hypothetical protein
MAALPGKVMPSASAIAAIVEAVPSCHVWSGYFRGGLTSSTRGADPNADATPPGLVVDMTSYCLALEPASSYGSVNNR